MGKTNRFDDLYDPRRHRVGGKTKRRNLLDDFEDVDIDDEDL